MEVCVRGGDEQLGADLAYTSITTNSMLWILACLRHLRSMHVVAVALLFVRQVFFTVLSMGTKKVTTFSVIAAAIVGYSC
jgi:hypothetical protein